MFFFFSGTNELTRVHFFQQSPVCLSEPKKAKHKFLHELGGTCTH